MVWCLALPLLTRLGGIGRPRLSLTQPVPHPGSSWQAQRWVSVTLPLRAVVVQSPVMGYAGPYLEPYGSDRLCSQRDKWVQVGSVWHRVGEEGIAPRRCRGGHLGKAVQGPGQVGAVRNEQHHGTPWVYFWLPWQGQVEGARTLHTPRW